MTKSLTHKNICPYYEENCINIGCVCPKYLAYEKASNPKEIEKQLEKMNVDFNDNKLSVMMNIQKHFSSRFFDSEKLTDEEISKWIKQYDTCITDEITEVHEHLDIFNDIYKNKEGNVAELQKEFIDIWHFVMDMFASGKMNSSQLIEKYFEVFGLPHQEKDTILVIFENENKQLVDSMKVSMSHGIDPIGVLVLTGHLLAGMRKVRQNISWKHWKKSNPNIDFNKLHESFVFVFSSLIKCLVLVGIDSDKLFNIYLSKNIENIFRQEFGY